MAQNPETRNARSPAKTRHSQWGTDHGYPLACRSARGDTRQVAEIPVQEPLHRHRVLPALGPHMENGWAKRGVGRETAPRSGCVLRAVAGAEHIALEPPFGGQGLDGVLELLAA